MLRSGSNFFMERLPNQRLNSQREALSPDEMNHILHQVGQFQRSLTGIRGDSFGLLGDTRRFPALHGLIRFLYENVLKDASAVTTANNPSWRALAKPISPLPSCAARPGMTCSSA